MLGAVVALGWGGCTNEPFDPASLANSPPVVRFFIAPGEPGGELNPTSYNRRTFAWSGSDQDGTVVAYYVSVRTARDVPAPWVETTRTDTTMTFTTDDEGHAEATSIWSAATTCGALSDTVVQYVPLRNFPPAINFQSDFEPFTNLQREIVPGQDGAPADTSYWNWGAMSARLFAYDPDGGETMADVYRYTVAEPLPDCVRPASDPAADPEVCWVEAPFGSTADIRYFEVLLRDLAPGPRTLTVAVSDEADAETRFTFSWDVRVPRGRVLLVPDNYGSLVSNLYRPFMDQYFGADGYDVYDFWYGYPDNPAVLLASLQEFDAVVWLGGGATSANLGRAATRGGVLEQYLLSGRRGLRRAASDRLPGLDRRLVSAAQLLPAEHPRHWCHVVTPQRAGAGGERRRCRGREPGRLAADAHARDADGAWRRPVPARGHRGALSLRALRPLLRQPYAVGSGHRLPAAPAHPERTRARGRHLVRSRVHGPHRYPGSVVRRHGTRTGGGAAVIRARLTLVLALCLLGGAATGQGTGTGIIKGRVYDAETGETMPYTNVYLAGTNIGTMAFTDGYYIMRGLRPGTYTVRATYISYAVASATVVVEAGQVVKLDFRLEVQAIMADVIEIAAERGLIEIERTGSSHYLSARQQMARCRWTRWST